METSSPLPSNCITKSVTSTTTVFTFLLYAVESAPPIFSHLFVSFTGRMEHSRIMRERKKDWVKRNSVLFMKFVRNSFFLWEPGWIGELAVYWHCPFFYLIVGTDYQGTSWSLYKLYKNLLFLLGFKVTSNYYSDFIWGVDFMAYTTLEFPSTHCLICFILFDFPPCCLIIASFF